MKNVLAFLFVTLLLLPIRAMGQTCSGVQTSGNVTSGHLAIFNNKCAISDGGAPTSQVYPAAGVAVSTGSAWASSVGIGTSGAVFGYLNGNNTFGGNDIFSNPITGNLLGNASTATALASLPSACSGSQFATGILANGNAICGTPSGGISSVFGRTTSAITAQTGDYTVSQVTGAAPIANPVHTGSINLGSSNPSNSLFYANASGYGSPTVPAIGVQGFNAPTYPFIHAHGDSITRCDFGGGGTVNFETCWLNILAQKFGSRLVDYGIDASTAPIIMAQDIFVHENPSATSQIAHIVAIGTNDSLQGTGGTAEAQYQQYHQAAMAWLALSSDQKVFAQASACTETGTWANDTTFLTGVGMKSATNGSTMTCSITTTGAPIYFWYQTNPAGTAAFTYAVDGGSAVSVSANDSAGLNTVAYIRIPSIAAGTHSVVFTVTSATGASNVVGIEALGSVLNTELRYYNNLQVFCGAIIPANGSRPNAVAYNVLSQADANLLNGDGLNVQWINVYPYLLPVNSANYVNDGLNVHPSQAGSLLMVQGYLQGMQWTPSVVQFPDLTYPPTSLAIGAYSMGSGEPTPTYVTGTALYNTAIGYHSMYSTTTGSTNVALGGYSLAANTTGQNNVAIGYNALLSDTNGYAVVAIGEGALQSYNSSDHPVAIGWAAGSALTSGGTSSVAIGQQSSLGTTSSNNVGIGGQANFGNTTGSGNTAIGVYALGGNQSGANNIAIGNGAVGNVTNPQGAIGIGQNSCTALNSTGCIGIGGSALGHATTGGGNIGIGPQAGNAITTGANNTVIGNNVATTTLTTGSYNILIGNRVDTPASSTSDYLNIGGVITGTGMNGAGTPAVGVNIGTATPLATLDVAGTIKTLGYTVSTLPTGAVGMRAYVTDQTTACPLAGAALTGSGAITCPVFYNGSAWVGD